VAPQDLVKEVITELSRNSDAFGERSRFTMEVREDALDLGIIE